MLISLVLTFRNLELQSQFLVAVVMDVVVEVTAIVLLFPDPGTLFLLTALTAAQAPWSLPSCVSCTDGRGLCHARHLVHTHLSSQMEQLLHIVGQQGLPESLTRPVRSRKPLSKRAGFPLGLMGALRTRSEEVAAQLFSVKRLVS